MTIQEWREGVALMSTKHLESQIKWHQDDVEYLKKRVGVKEGPLKDLGHCAANLKHIESKLEVLLKEWEGRNVSIEQSC